MIQIAGLVGWLLGAAGAIEPWESVCRPTVADTARPGLQECARLSSGGVRILARVKADVRGMRHSEWSAEQGLNAVHVPDETFWRILDGLAGSQGEWLERDPSTLGQDSILFEARVGQSFECRGCPGDWLAGTWGPYGASRLLVVRRDPVKRQALDDSLALVPQAQASSAVLPLKVSTPCRDKGGNCLEERIGPGGTRWQFRRERSGEGWQTLRVEWESQPLGDSISLSLLREDLPPSELRLLLRNWLDAEIDMFAANVLAPAPTLFTTSVSSWRRRVLPGFRTEAILKDLGMRSSFPDSLLLYQDKFCRAGIAGKIRWFEIRRAR
ncbi:MAG: hypothetical protein RL318_2225 [Fibrobacterota bacterium]|jgi:hypothetical protein